MPGLERRDGNKAVPSDLKEYLTAEQMRAYRCMQGFGWRMYFVRRPLFQTPTAVMINDVGTRIGLLEMEGHLDMSPAVELRN